MKPRRDLVFVSAGLGLDGGGRAVAGRLLAGGCAGFARGRGLGFRLLTLDGAGLPDSDVPVHGFGGGPAGARARGLEAAVERPRVGLRLRPSRTGADAGLLPVRSAPPISSRSMGSRSGGRSTGTAAGRSPTPPWSSPSPPTPWSAPGRSPPASAARARRPPGPGGAQAGGSGGRRCCSAGSAAASSSSSGAWTPASATRGTTSSWRRCRGSADGPGWWWPATATTAAGWRRRRRRLEIGGPRRLHRLHQRGDPGGALPALRRLRDAEPGRGLRARLPGGDAGRQAVLAARGSAAEEIVIDGETGLLVDPDDREELRVRARPARSITPATTRRMGEAGRERWRRSSGSSGSGSGWSPCWRGSAGNGPMCGINGILRLAAAAPRDRSRRAAAHPRRHDRRAAPTAPARGSRATAASPSASRRLAILDLSRGGRAAHGVAGRPVRIVFNGEIYNFRELRAGAGGARARASARSSDTEVLLALYARDGAGHARRGCAACSPSRSGTSGRRRLLLARDPLRHQAALLRRRTGGMPPLRLAGQGAASRRRGLRASRSRRASPGSCSGARCPSRSRSAAPCRALPAGTPAGRATGGSASRSRYADRDGPGRRHAAATPAAGGRGLGARAHLVSGRAGRRVFLSAGLDSALIAALARRQRREPPLTFTLRFDDFAGRLRTRAPLAAEVARRSAPATSSAASAATTSRDLWPAALGRHGPADHRRLQHLVRQQGGARGGAQGGALRPRRRRALRQLSVVPRRAARSSGRRAGPARLPGDRRGLARGAGALAPDRPKLAGAAPPRRDAARRLLPAARALPARGSAGAAGRATPPPRGCGATIRRGRRPSARRRHGHVADAWPRVHGWRPRSTCATSSCATPTGPRWPGRSSCACRWSTPGCAQQLAGAGFEPARERRARRRSSGRPPRSCRRRS